MKKVTVGLTLHQVKVLICESIFFWAFELILGLGSSSDEENEGDLEAEQDEDMRDELDDSADHSSSEDLDHDRNQSRDGHHMGIEEEEEGNVHEDEEDHIDGSSLSESDEV